MAYTDYLKRVVFRDSNGNGYVVPVTNIKVWYEPWHSSGKTIVRYFHGQNARRIQGYQGFAEFDMNFPYHGIDDATLSSFLNAVQTNKTLTIDFDPDSDPGNKVMTVILDDVRGSVGAGFSEKIRNRAVRLKFIDPLIRAEIPTWVVGVAADSFLLDPSDLILYEPTGLTFDSVTNEFIYWTNRGSLGATADQSAIWPYADVLPDQCEVDADLGNVYGCVWSYPSGDKQATWNGVNNLGTVINDADEDFDIWLAIKSSLGGSYVSFWTDLGGAQGMTVYQNEVTGSIGISFGVTSVVSSPSGFADSDWHVIRIVANLSTNNVTLIVDGYVVGSGTTSAAMGGGSGNGLSLGAYGSTGLQEGKIGFFKVSDGVLLKGRSREIYAYLRDTWNFPGLPADGTATQFIYGTPAQGDIRSTSLLAGSTEAVFDNQAASVGLSVSCRKDDSNEYLYYTEYSTGVARLKRMSYGGADITFVTTTSPTLKRGRGIALNLVDNEGYMSNGTTGQTLNKHSLDPADAADAWTELIASGAGYSMYQAIEYNPTDGYIYFVDSAPATPVLRKILPDGTGDTSVATLTGSAGSIWGYLTKDPDNNVLYMTDQNNAAGISKYDLDTSTWTKDWRAADAGEVARQPDVSNGKLWYPDQTNGKIYEIDLATPSTRTLLLTPTSGVYIYGMVAVVFDTTA